MKIEKLIADYQANGRLSSVTANQLLRIYQHEVVKHGNQAKARETVANYYESTTEVQRRAAARIIEAHVHKTELSKPVHIAIRLGRAIIGSVIGALIAAAVAYACVLGLILLITTIFGSAPSRVRVPVKGVLAVALAPVFGAIMGALIGWRFSFRDAVTSVAEKLTHWRGRAGHSKSDKVIGVLDDAISFSAEKWRLHFDTLPFKDEMSLKGKIALFLPPLREGLRTKFPAISDAPAAIALLVAAKGIERSGTHTAQEIESALGIKIPQ